MAYTTKVKRGLNKCLQFFNLRLETVTAIRSEEKRLQGLEESGWFFKPVVPLLPAFKMIETEVIISQLEHYASRLSDFCDARLNDVAYTFRNGWFGSPDAEVAYVILRQFRPRLVIEIGSGHSTKIIRQGLTDSGSGGRLVAIDPDPRIDIAGYADEIVRRRVEECTDVSFFRDLRSGDVLFIDSSHEIKTGNDVVFLFLSVLPQLAPGVLIHVHDIFLPYEYPKGWLVDNRWRWTEQYLLQALLTTSDAFDVLWAGHYLQRTQGEFFSWFPYSDGEDAKSVWLRRRP